MKTAVRVPVIESERGWGSKIDDYMICPSVEDAKKFIIEFNSENNKETVPDWYMYATDDIYPIDLTDEQYDILLETEKKRIWQSSFE